MGKKSTTSPLGDTAPLKDSPPPKIVKKAQPPGKKHHFKILQSPVKLVGLYPVHNIPLPNKKHNFLKKSFFPSTIIKWNNLDPRLRKAESFYVFKSNIRKFILPSPNSVYNCHNPSGICLIARFRLGLSHLREHKVKHGFQEMLNPLCSRGNEEESTKHVLSTLGNFNYSLLDNTRMF